MNKNYPFSELTQKVSSAQKIIIVLPPKPFFDQVAAGLALFLGLKDSGKTVSVVCPSPMTVEFNHLVGVDKIATKVQGTDLIVSFNYSSEQIEKVSYNDDNNRPNLVIQPKAGAPPISESLATFSYAGTGADLIFALGIKDPTQSLSQLDLNSSFVVNVDTVPSNTNFGQINIVDLSTSGLCEVVLGVISGLAVSLGADAAQNLIDGLWAATRGLTAGNLGADTYEAVAICLRSGARRPVTDDNRRGEVFTPRKPVEAKPAENKPINPVNVEKPKEPEKPSGKPPADWFEPKIFRGTSLS